MVCKGKNSIKGLLGSSKVFFFLRIILFVEES